MLSILHPCAKLKMPSETTATVRCADLPSHQATPRLLYVSPCAMEYGNLLGLHRRPGRRLAGAGLTAPRAGRTGKGRLSSGRGPPGCPARTSGPGAGASVPAASGAAPCGAPASSSTGVP